MDLIKKFLSLLWLNILWLVCCIPVITAGASTCAAFAVTLRFADEDEEVNTFGGIARRFFKALKQDFLQGILIFMFTAAGLSLGYFLFDRARDYGFNLIIILLLFVYAMFVLILNLYAYPLIARYSNTFVNTLRNSVAIFIMNTKVSLRTLALVILEIAVLYFTRYIYFAGLLILPALIFYTVSRTAKDIFVRMENPAPAESEELSEENTEETD